MSESSIEHLEEAETALMSWVARLSSIPEDGELVVDDADLMPMLLAVLRHISRAAGQLHGERMLQEMISPIPPPFACPHCGAIRSVQT